MNYTINNVYCLLLAICISQSSLAMEQCIIPSGNMIEKTYFIDSDFNTTHLNAVRLAFGKLVISQLQDPSSRQHLLVKTSDNIIDFIKPKLTGPSDDTRALELRCALAEDGLMQTNPIQAEIQYFLKVKSLRVVEVLERASVFFDTDFKAPSLSLYTQDTASIKTKKLAVDDYLKINMSGHATITIDDLTCKKIKEKIFNNSYVSIFGGNADEQVIQILNNCGAYSSLLKTLSAYIIVADNKSVVSVNVDNDLRVNASAPEGSVINYGKAEIIRF